MKTINLKSLGVFVLALSLTTSVFAGTQKVDASKSTVKWLGKKVTGEHFGSIAVKEGSLEITGGKVTGGKVVIDMQSLTVEDVKDAVAHQVRRTLEIATRLKAGATNPPKARTEKRVKAGVVA